MLRYKISELAELADSIEEITQNTHYGVDKWECQAELSDGPCGEPVGFALAEVEMPNSDLVEFPRWNIGFELPGEILVCEDCSIAVDAAKEI